MGRKCEFYWCANQQGVTAGKSFYGFPRDEQLCRRWVSSCNSAEISSTFDTQGVSALKKRVICADHFPREAFQNLYRLAPGAVPYDASDSEDLPADPQNATCCLTVHGGVDNDVRQEQDTEELYPAEYLEFDETQANEIPTTLQDSSEPFFINNPVSGELYKVEYLDDDDSVPTQESGTNFCSLPKTDEPGLEENDDNDTEQRSKSTSVGPLFHTHTLSSISDDEEGIRYDSSEPVFESEKIRHADSRTFDDANNQNVDLGTAGLGEITVSSDSGLQARLKVEEKKYQNLKQDLNVIKRKLFVTKQTSERRLEVISRKKLQLAKLRVELKALKRSKTADEVIGIQAKQNPIILDSLKNESRSPKGRRYSRATTKFASGTYLSGPRTYRFIKNSKILTLPHKNSVYNYNRAIRIEPGINFAILATIKKKLRKVKHRREKVVVITCDGMSLKQELSYSAKADMFHGFPDDGIRRKIEKNDWMKPATEAVTVMISGLYLRFKQPIGYVLAHNSLDSQNQLKFIKRSVRAVRKCGMFPVVITMDQCTTNVKMAREAGVTIKRPLIDIDGKKIAFMYDTPHLTKNARNAIFKYNAVFDSQVASFAHIRQLHDIEVSTPVSLKLAPKLTPKCVQLPPFTAMNVSLATRTLSESCAIALHYYVSTKELPPLALQTAEFLRLHDKLFDVFNSKETYANSIGKPYRTPITSDSLHFEFLADVLRILQNMFFTTNTCFHVDEAEKAINKLKSMQRQPNYLRGFQMNIHAVKWLWNYLRKQFKVPYLCTNPLCQDCLENFFSEIRRRCGFNDSPNAFQFGSAFKYAMVAAADQSFNDGRNCEHDGIRPILNEDDVNAFQTSKQGSFSYCFEEIDSTVPFVALKKDFNALVYILGAAVHKLRHEKCREKLTAQKDDKCFQNEDYSFIMMKASLSRRSVTIPNNALYDIGMVAFVCFRLKFRKFLYENKKDVKKRLKAYLDHQSFDASGICKECFDKLIDIIFNTFIQGFLRDARFQLKLAGNRKRAMKKRNRKAVRMNLPEMI